VGRRTAASLLVLALSLAGAPSASAALQSANFTARISGTYTTSGTVTNTACYTEDDSGNRHVFTASGAASETTSFRATRGMLLGASKQSNERRIVAGGLPIPVSARMTRSSNLESGGTQPQGCKPSSFPSKTTCGTKTKGYKLAVYGVGRGYGFSYNFSRGFSTFSPDDPFECPLVAGDHWWGAYFSRGNGTAKVSLAKLFNRRIKAIVVKATLAKSPRATGSDYSASASERLSWTLTLTRRR
jgi:hypothetical protein